jgi:hypothetical protein
VNPALNHSAIPLLKSVDLLVVGAGSAGCCAALAAKGAGVKSVLLVERYGFLGGISTGVLDTFYGFFTPGDQPRKVVGGIPDQVVDLLDAAQSAFLRPNTYGAGTGITYNPEHLKAVWDRLCLAAGVEVLNYSFLVDAIADSSGRITQVVLCTRNGFVRIEAKRFIDSSGDADFCHWAGLPLEVAGELEPAQTMTTTFRLAGVDLDRFQQAGGKKMLMERMKNDDTLPRKAGSAHAMPIPNCVSTVAVRVGDLSGLDSWSLTSAEREGRRQALVYENFFRKNVPGYEEARLIGLSVGIGVRESRRVFGDYRLTREDCLSAARFEDRVFLCGAPIEDHRLGQDGQEETAWAYIPDSGVYDVPYRTLVPAGRDECWVAGRCFSATHDAHASCRSMGQTMSMGQAAGIAAALSLELDCSARAVPISLFQDHLRRLGVPLEPPQEVANTAAKAWKENRKTNLL